MPEVTFYIEEYLDDSGTATYIAFHAEDFDGKGVPFAHAPRAEGETPLQAIAALCAMLDNININDAAQQPIKRTA